MASISKGARNAFSRACATCSGVACASRARSAAAKTSASRPRADSGTITKRQGVICPWSGAAAAEPRIIVSCAASGAGLPSRLGSTVWRE